MDEIKKLQNEIEDLKQQLITEILVKKNEMEVNKSFQEIIKGYELQVESLLKINDEYAKNIIKLRKKIQDLIF